MGDDALRTRRLPPEYAREYFAVTRPDGIAAAVAKALAADTRES